MHKTFSLVHSVLVVFLLTVSIVGTSYAQQENSTADKANSEISNEQQENKLNKIT